MAEITGKLMTGRPVATFMVLQDFIAPEFQNQEYPMGGKYTLREGNEKLAGSMHAWVGLSRISISVIDPHDDLMKIVYGGLPDGDNT